MLAPPTSAGEVDAIVARIAEGMAPAIALPDGHAVAIALSVGYAVYPEDGRTSGDLVRKADKAMYRDKLRRCDDGAIRPH